MTRSGEAALPPPQAEPLSWCEWSLKAVFGCIKPQGPVRGCRLIHPESNFAFVMQMIIMVSSVHAKDLAT